MMTDIRLKLKIIIVMALTLLPIACQKENPDIPGYKSETFYVENNGSSMRVLVDGNTAGKVFIVFVHGGPGISSFIYNTDHISEDIEAKYAVVYWDQPNSGASQGNNNGDDLNFANIIDDLDKIIKVIKYRYGNDIELFLMSHSFGGLIASGFITEGNNQNLFRGYINIEGSHNYPLNDTLTREMLLTVGSQQLLAGHHVKQWDKIIDYCKSHTGDFSLEESSLLERYASQAEGYIDSVKQVKYLSLLLSNSISENIPLTSILVNQLYTSYSHLNTEISAKEFSSALVKITIPCLLLFGKYDFVCPPALGMDFYSRISSSEKKVFISQVSGHNLMFQDKDLFSGEVISFIETTR